jgi:F0F1-type ATP synthase delta subunit
MTQLTINQLANYAVGELISGKSTKTVSEQIASTLIQSNRGDSTKRFERAVVDELAVRGITQITITSALPVGNDTLRNVAQILGVSKPLFNEIIDESVVGGFRAETSNNMLDMTAQHKLKQFIQEIGKQ